MGAVESLFVIEVSPSFDQHLGFSPASEPFAIKQLLAQLTVETLNDAVPPGASRGDEGH